MLEEITKKIKKKKKRSFRHYFRKYKLYFIFFFIGLFLFIFFIIFRPVLFKSWLNYPLDLKAEIAFDYYKTSFKDKCLGTCLKEREMLAKIISLAWQKRTDYWQEKIFSHLINSQNIDEQKALVNLSLEVYQKNDIPISLKNIVFSHNFSYEIRHHIIKAYDKYFLSDNDLYLSLISEALDSHIELKQRQSALLATKVWQNKDNYQLSLNILASQESIALKESALDLINSWSIREIILNEEDILLITQLANDESLLTELRVRLVWLLSEYSFLYSNLVIESLEEIYNNKNLDKISRGFSAKALNHLGVKNLEIPEISQSEWDAYYQVY
jgi:hypothetical protein